MSTKKNYENKTQNNTNFDNMNELFYFNLEYKVHTTRNKYIEINKLNTKRVSSNLMVLTIHAKSILILEYIF